jgi:Flp pilus assembly protein TadD
MALGEAFGLGPAERRAVLRMGRAELAAGRVEEAVETLWVAMVLDPTDRAAREALADALHRSGDGEAAAFLRREGEALCRPKA